MWLLTQGEGLSRGWIYCVDAIRPGAGEMVQTLLRQYKLRCLILSGDRSAGLKQIAAQLGIFLVYSSGSTDLTVIYRAILENDRCLKVNGPLCVQLLRVQTEQESMNTTHVCHMRRQKRWQN
jgi:hypothetical protein